MYCAVDPSQAAQLVLSSATGDDAPRYLFENIVHQVPDAEWTFLHQCKPRPEDTPQRRRDKFEQMHEYIQTHLEMILPNDRVL